MPWVKLDDHFDQHPKIAAAGPLGVALWVTGLAYCNRNLTDGFIPWAVARSLLSWEYLDDDGKVRTVGVYSGHVGDDVSCAFVIDILLNAGLWEEAKGGYRIHDFDQYQPSKSDVMSERERGGKRQQKHRDKSRNAVSHAVTDAVIPAMSQPCHAGPVPVKGTVVVVNAPKAEKPRSLGAREQQQPKPARYGPHPQHCDPETCPIPGHPGSYGRLP